MTDPHTRLAELAAQLADADVADELIADRIVPRVVLGIRRPDRLRRIDRGWRLGVVLLTRAGALRTVGTAFRAVEPAHSALRSTVATERLELQRAARRARIPLGETVHVDTVPLDLARPAEPLAIAGGEFRIRWARAADAVPLWPYLDEQVALRRTPPEGAGEAERA